MAVVVGGAAVVVVGSVAVAVAVVGRRDTVLGDAALKVVAAVSRPIVTIDRVGWGRVGQGYSTRH